MKMGSQRGREKERRGREGMNESLAFCEAGCLTGLIP